MHFSDRIKNNWKRLSSAVIIKEGVFRIRKDRMLNKSQEKEFDITVMEARDAVNIIAINPNDQIVFVEQFRFGIQSTTLELPGGLLDVGEDVESAAGRELIEETGYLGGHYQYLGKTASHPVFMNSYIHHVLIKDVMLDGSTKFDDGEMLQTHLIPKADVSKMLKEGRFNHPHTIAALVRYL